MRIHCHTQQVRQGRVIKQSDDVRFAVTTYGPQEASPQALLELARGHWSIENGQHYPHFTPLESRESLDIAGVLCTFLFQANGYSFPFIRSRIFCCSWSAWVT